MQPDSFHQALTHLTSLKEVCLFALGISCWKLRVVVHAFDSSTQEIEAEEFLCVQGQPELHDETLLQNTKIPNLSLVLPNMVATRG